MIQFAAPDVLRFSYALRCFESLMRHEVSVGIVVKDEGLDSISSANVSPGRLNQPGR